MEGRKWSGYMRISIQRLSLVAKNILIFYGRHYEIYGDIYAHHTLSYSCVDRPHSHLHFSNAQEAPMTLRAIKVEGRKWSGYMRISIHAETVTQLIQGTIVNVHGTVYM